MTQPIAVRWGGGRGGREEESACTDKEHHLSGQRPINLKTFEVSLCVQSHKRLIKIDFQKDLFIQMYNYNNIS